MFVFLIGFGVAVVTSTVESWRLSLAWKRSDSPYFLDGMPSSDDI
jgi:hypothetical protein